MSRFLPYSAAILLLGLAPALVTAQDRPTPATAFVRPQPVALLEAPPAASLAPTTPSLSRHVTVGAAVGAGVGLLAAASVLLSCGDWCSNDRPLGIALFTVGGAALGAAGGAVVWAARR